MTMAPYYQLVLWLCCYGALHIAHGYSNGATPDTCASMRPQHGVPGQATTPPYTVTTNKLTYRASEEIQVTISGTEIFTGFLLEAVSTDRSTHVGNFITAGNTDIKTIGCGEGLAATNAKKLLRTSSIMISWQAPAQTVGNIRMMVTVVKNLFTFWVKIPSLILREVLPTLPPNFPGGPVTTPGPGINPGICQPEDTGIGLSPITTESYTIKWTYLPCSNPPEVEFDITAGVSDSPLTSHWVAIGFSKDEYMGDDSVIECLQVQNNQVAFRASYNERGVKSNVVISGTNIGLVPLSATVGNGKFNCRFRRAVFVPGDPRIFDLRIRKYRLLAARGVTNGDAEKFAHSVVYKSSPVVSSEFISFEKSGYLKTMK